MLRCLHWQNQLLTNTKLKWVGKGRDRTIVKGERTQKGFGELGQKREGMRRNWIEREIWERGEE